ncbi:MAG: hypothetical protein OEY23_09280 [Acidimicrobiia bacterium]|nr:hypothetical protein [Acidimicrobiia bacterium]
MPASAARPAEGGEWWSPDAASPATNPTPVVAEPPVVAAFPPPGAEGGSGRAKRVLLWLVAALVAVAVGVGGAMVAAGRWPGGDDRSSATSTSQPPPGGGPAASAGVDTTATSAGDGSGGVVSTAPGPPPCTASAVSGDVVAVDGRPVHVSAPAATGARLATLLILDGHAGSPALIERYSQARARLSAQGFVVAELSGNDVGTLDVDGNPLGGWNISDDASVSTLGSFEQDAAYIGNVVANLVATRCADPARIGIVGLSAGGVAALQAACTVDPAAVGFDGFTMVAAVAAPVSAAAAAAPPLSACRSWGRSTLLVVGGTLDEVVPPGGGGRYDAAALVEWVVPLAGQAIGCGPFSPYPVAATAEIPLPAGCGGSGRALLLVVDGLGHAWPGGEPIGFHQQALHSTIAGYVQANPRLTPSAWDFTDYLRRVFEQSWPS